MNVRRPRWSPTTASALALVIAITFGAIVYQGFATPLVARNLVADNTFLLLAACGAWVVILSGGIDLSVGSVMAFTAVVIAALVERAGVHPALALAVALAASTVFGALQGACVHCLQLPAFLVTLAGLFLMRGLAFAVVPRSVGIDHPVIATVASASLPLPGVSAGLPVASAVAIVMVVALALAMAHTGFGRWARALGGGVSAAAAMGVPIARTRVGVYALSGLFSGAAGAALVVYQQSGDPASCKGLELDAIAAVVVGGASLRGGAGSVVGVVLGVALLGVTQMLLVFQGDLSAWWTRIAVGGLLLAFLGVNAVGERVAERSG